MTLHANLFEFNLIQFRFLNLIQNFKFNSNTLDRVSIQSKGNGMQIVIKSIENMLMSMVLKKKTLKRHQFENAYLSIPCYLRID
jgi:hypothetical protein